MHVTRLLVPGITALTIAASCSLFTPVASAGNTGAFVGGMLTSRVLHNMSARTRAEQQQAYYAQQEAQAAQQQAAQPAPAPQAAAPQAAAPAEKSVEEKLDQLDALAAGGYITPEEYKTRREAIINSL